ncbi:uncharacterized protein LOC143247041 isoform X1 [Tachypleus tridentatus]|uniref:uncharacterized protein LOC143247041 isoform X1 n=1 Tax=Tachypleus tridentatus TaxID=6853 RepID=UPI003FD6A75C
MKILTPSKHIADTILRNGCYYHIFHFSAERPRRHPMKPRTPKQPVSDLQLDGISTFPTVNPQTENQSSDKYTQTDFGNKISQSTQTTTEESKTCETSTSTGNIQTADAVSQTKTDMIHQKTQCPENIRFTRASSELAVKDIQFRKTLFGNENFRLSPPSPKQKLDLCITDDPTCPSDDSSS